MKKNQHTSTQACKAQCPIVSMTSHTASCTNGVKRERTEEWNRDEAATYSNVQEVGGTWSTAISRGRSETDVRRNRRHVCTSSPQVAMSLLRLKIRLRRSLAGVEFRGNVLATNWGNIRVHHDVKCAWAIFVTR